MSEQNFRTPPWLFAQLQRLAGTSFVLDAAASKHNALCRRYYTEEDDGLSLPWDVPTFCNPPFRHFGDWIEHGFGQAQKHRCVVVLLGPTGCSQLWFHAFARRGTIYAPTERIVFHHPETGAPTDGAARDTMAYLFGPKFWNNGPAFRLNPLDVEDGR